MTLKTMLAACCMGVFFSANAMAWTSTTSGNGPQSIAEQAPSQAQEQNAHSSSRSTAYSHSNSRSSSRATGGSATGGNVVVNNSASGGNGAGYNVGRFPAASAYAPSFGSASPCTGSAMSGGGQGLVGVSLGFQQMDKFCQVDRLGNLNTAGQRIDFAWQCLDRGAEFRKAAANAGYPCPEAKPKVQETATVKEYWPDWCYTASPGEVRQHEECRGAPHE